jgi:CRP/FNR family cyclic AMP-dependent transcriptional regulator
MTTASCYLFRGLTEEKMRAIYALAESRTVSEGEWLFHKAEPAEHIFLVEEGAIELILPVEPSIEVPVALIRPGNGCVGVGALVDPYRYTLSARCKIDSRLTTFDGPELRLLFQADPVFGYTVMTNLAQRLQERLLETREEIKLHFMNLIQSATFS